MAATIQTPFLVFALILVCATLNLRITAAVSIGTTDGNVLRTSFFPNEEAVFTCSGGSDVQFVFNNALSFLIGEYDGFSVTSFTHSGTRTIILTINEFNGDNVGTYNCSDGDGSETVSVTFEEYSLSISGMLPVIEGDIVNVTCDFNSEGHTEISYNWTAIDDSGAKRVLANGSRLVLLDVPQSDSGGQYICEVTVNGKGGPVVFTTSKDIVIIFRPVINGPLFNNLTVFTTEDESSSFQLPCDISDDAAEISWTVKGESLASTDPDTRYTVNQFTNALSVGGGISYSDEGVYMCTGSNEAGTASVSYHVQVQGSPIISTISGQSFEVIEGDSLMLPCAYQSNPDSSVSLQFASVVNGTDVFGAVDNALYDAITGGAFVLSSVNIAYHGQLLYCVVTNTFGSANISYTIEVTGKPPAPTGVMVGEVTAESVMVSWDEYTGEYNTAPDNYMVTIVSIDTGLSFEYRVGGNSIPVSGLIPNTGYLVQVSGYNRAGSSQLSSETFSTLKSAPRFKYFNITSLEGGRSLQFDWLLLFDGGSSVTTFEIIITSSEMTTPITISIEVERVNSGTHLITDLEPRVLYSVQTSLANENDSAQVEYQITTARGPPTKPTTPTVDMVQISSVQITFEIPSTGSDSIDYYLVNISSDNSIWQLTIQSDHSEVLSVTSTDAVNSGGQIVVLLVKTLDGDSTYSFSVSAGGSAGNGPFSEYSESVTTENGMVLYFIIAGVIGGSLLIIMIILIIAGIMFLVSRRRRRRIGQKHTITSRLHEPNDFGFPNSSMSENVQNVNGYSPPSSSMDDRKEDLLPPPPYSKINHSRNHSVSSTASSQYRKPDYLRVDQQTSLDITNADSAYGGSAEKIANTIYHEIPPRCHSVSAGVMAHYSHSSLPMINRLASYDGDRLPPRQNQATFV